VIVSDSIVPVRQVPADKEKPGPDHQETELFHLHRPQKSHGNYDESHELENSTQLEHAGNITCQGPC